MTSLLTMAAAAAGPMNEAPLTEFGPVSTPGMMVWVVAIALAIASFAVGVLVFRLPKATWASLAAALVFGLAGYTLQASPDVPAAPKALQQESFSDDWQILYSRELLVGQRLKSGSRMMVTANGFARQGRFETASQILRGIVEENPQDFEAWVALGNALTEQADGTLTQASVYAFREASEIAPENPAPSYFMGLSLIRTGRMMEAYQLWSGALRQMPLPSDGTTPDDATLFMADRVMRLEQMLQQSGALPPAEAGSDTAADQQQ